jgi:hypothetical protein
MHNARRLTKEIYATVPLFPRSLFLDGADVSIEGGDETKGSYQGIMVRILCSSGPQWIEVSIGMSRVLCNNSHVPKVSRPRNTGLGNFSAREHLPVARCIF